MRTIVDGAHAVAHFPFRNDAIGCDHYGSSLHKRLFAPIGTCLLYTAKDRIAQCCATACPAERTGSIAGMPRRTRHMATFRRRTGTAGFTLVELLLVTAILALLGVFASAAVTSATAPPPPGGVDASATAPEAPLSPAALLLRLAGVAVLLFGAGFWYTAELCRPGRLDRFHFGQFLLLALTYCLFFVAFAVLHDREWPPWQAVAVAAAVSFPLVTMHVASVVDWRFAGTAALPLTAVTTAIVVNGVYGGELRSIVYLGMVSAAVAFLTLSHPRLVQRRHQQMQAIEKRLCAEVAALQEPTEALQRAEQEARQTLAQPDPEQDLGLRSTLEHAVAAAEDLLTTSRSMREHVEVLTAPDNARERTAAREALQERLPRLRRGIARTRTALREADTALADQRKQRQQRQTAPTHEHCVACGHPTGQDSHYCANCGQPTAEHRRCRTCAQTLHLPRHLLRNGSAGPRPVTHCPRCGDLHALAG